MLNIIDLVRRRIGSRLMQRVEDFWDAVDSERVGIVQAIGYFMIFLDCIYNLVIVDLPVQVVEDALQGNAYVAWLLLGVTGPVLTYAAKRVKQNGPNGLAAMWAMFTGDLMVLACLTVYIVSTLYTQWGQANFAGCLAIIVALAVALFVVRDLRRITQRDQWVEWPT